VIEGAAVPGMAGDSAEGARLADGIRPAAPVLLEALGELPVTSLDLVHQDPPVPAPVHERGCLLDQLTPDTIDAVVREASAPGSPLMLAEIRQLGGAIARDPGAPNAVPGRTAPFVLFAIALDIPRARLLDIKQGWDLDNMFRVGHALLPAPAPAGVQPESSLIRASLTAPPPTRS
jgi:hypothetical protein